MLKNPPWTTQREYRSERFRRLSAVAPPDCPYGERVERLCETLAGSPYRVDPLGGSADSPETFTVSLTAFDCVTFLEEVTAFCAAHSEDEFLDRLRLLRYDGGRVEWRRRRHYFSEWLAGNETARRIRRLEVDGRPAREWQRSLRVLTALGERPATVWGWPKTSLAGLRPHLRTGDLVAFISTRADLDYFHAGLLIVRGPGTLLAHASRSAGGVVLVPLSEFLRRQRMSGLTVARPWPNRPDNPAPKEKSR
jgi:hypothetical protein